VSEFADAPTLRAPPRERFWLCWAGEDRFPKLTTLLIVGTLGAAALALFGLPPVDIHEPTHYLGIMGPSCGMTRTVRWLAHGDLLRAWQFNPAVFLLAAAAVLVGARAVFGRVTGGWIEVRVRGRVVTAVVVTALAVLWLNQQLHAAFIMSAR
jgi:hypothetical protein